MLQVDVHVCVYNTYDDDVDDDDDDDVDDGGVQIGIYLVRNKSTGQSLSVTIFPAGQ